MHDFKVYIAEEFDKKIRKINKKDKSLIENKLEIFIIPQLKSEPHYGNNIKKLKNYKPETWRYKIGNYRIFYQINIELKEVNILTIIARKDAY